VTSTALKLTIVEKIQDEVASRWRDNCFACLLCTRILTIPYNYTYLTSCVSDEV